MKQNPPKDDTPANSVYQDEEEDAKGERTELYSQAVANIAREDITHRGTFEKFVKLLGPGINRGR